MNYNTIKIKDKKYLTKHNLNFLRLKKLKILDNKIKNSNNNCINIESIDNNNYNNNKINIINEVKYSLNLYNIKEGLKSKAQKSLDNISSIYLKTERSINYNNTSSNNLNNKFINSTLNTEKDIKNNSKISVNFVKTN